MASFSVRTRITVAVFLLVALGLAGTGGLVYGLGVARIAQVVPQVVSQEVEEFNQLQSKGIDPQTGEPFESSRRLVRTFLERNVPSTSELLVGFWADSVRQRSVSSRAELVQDPAFVGTIRERLGSGGVSRIDTRWGEVYVDVQPLRDLQGDGAFVVAYFVEDEREPLRRTMRTYAVAAAIALALVTVVAAWQAGQLLRPVRTLRETAQEITETDLSRRIPEVGNDDLTDLTRTVNAMLGRLHSAFEGQRAFLDDAGHELRTPLTILRGHLELLDVADPEEVGRTLDLLLDEVDRMSRLVDDLILLTKADRPDFFTFAPVHVGELTDAVAMKVRALGDRDWQLDQRADADVVIDEQRVTQAMIQLAQNAVKHTGPQDTIGVGSSMSERPGWLRFWVRDTGTGVADEYKDVIFERFARAEHGRAEADHAQDDRVEDDRVEGDRVHEGFGLGLSIVAAIAAGHGGTAQVTDEVPAGARFVIDLRLRSGAR